MTARPTLEHADFANVVRVARFHQAPQRLQPHLDQRHDQSNIVLLNRRALVGRLLASSDGEELPSDCAPPD